MAVFYMNFKLAFWVFLLASLSDALDGFLARKLRQITTLGVILDPIADKALIDSAFVFLSYTGKVPVWLAVLVISRDVIIIAGGWLLVTFGKMEGVKPTKVGKVTAFSQFFTVLLVLSDLNFDICSATCIELSYAMTACLTVASAFLYSLRGVKELSSEKIPE